jgi:hypothetical protein
VLIGLLSVPQVRAFVAEVLRIGAVRIFVTEPTPTAVPTLSATPNLLTSVLQLPGETTLEDAQEKSKFDLPLSPEYGAPDHVYYQQLGGSLVTLVWTKPEAPDEVLFSIQILNQNLVASKFYPFGVEEEVSVNDHRAYWLTRAHQLVYFYGERELRRMIDSNVLIWTIEPLTYRLETDLSLEETLKIAESLE